MINTLGNLYRIAPNLKDEDLDKVTTLLFGNLNGDTYRISVDQLKIIMGVNHHPLNQLHTETDYTLKEDDLVRFKGFGNELDSMVYRVGQGTKDNTFNLTEERPL